MMVVHEIEQDGKSYFLEWDKEGGTIQITECCDATDEEHEEGCDCLLETYDFKEEE